MSDIAISDVQKLAKLSAIAISDEDATTLQQELTTILGYVELLSEVDTSQVKPTYQVTGHETVTRDDEIIDYGVEQAELLKNAPDQQNGQIKVPRVL